MSDQNKGLFDDEDDEGKIFQSTNPNLFHIEYKPVELEANAEPAQAEQNPYAAEEQQEYTPDYNQQPD